METIDPVEIIYSITMLDVLTRPAVVIGWVGWTGEKIREADLGKDLSCQNKLNTDLEPLGGVWVRGPERSRIRLNYLKISTFQFRVASSDGAR